MYERFFGFRELPFRLTPDPNYLFLSRKHGEAFAHLLYAVREGSGFVAITGEIGAGKTTLVRTLLKELRDTKENVAAAYIFNPVYSPVELLQSVNAELGLPSRSTSKKELTENLNAFLLAQRVEGGRTVVIVDEAQNLDPAVLEELRLLSNLETETDKLIHIVLIGQPELRDLLERPELLQLAQRITVRWHLSSLDRTETAEYVRHRLRVAGGMRVADLFDAKALGLVYEHSGGVPRLINIVAHRSLLVAYTKGVQTVGAAEVAVAAAELEEGRYPLSKMGRRWIYRAAAGVGIAAAAAAVAFLLLAPLGGGEDRASGTPEAAPAVGRSEAKAVHVEQKLAAKATRLPETDRRTADDPAKLVRAGERLSKRLEKESVFEGAVHSVSSLLELWGKEPLSAGERAGPALELDAIAKARGLNYLAGEMNADLVQAIDLPAILELTLDDDAAPHYVVLAGLDASRAVLQTDKRIEVPRQVVLSMWNGRAHILWKDHERLRRSMGPGSGGPAVLRLQALLRETGVFKGIVNGIYGADSEKAVRVFQSSHSLVADGVAGPITQIMLYNAIERFQRPRLLADVKRVAGGEAS